MTPKTVLAIRREYQRAKKMHFENVRRFMRGKCVPERDYYLMMGAHQALAWAAGDNAQRPSVACAPLPYLKKRKAEVAHGAR